MFVCVCRAVTEARVRSLIQAGAESLESLESACGAGGDCGMCCAELTDILDASRPATCRRSSEAA